MCIRDSYYSPCALFSLLGLIAYYRLIRRRRGAALLFVVSATCLLYTSPSPRDGLLSIRRQRQDVYKRQLLQPLRSILTARTDCLLSIDPAAAGRGLAVRRLGHLSLIHISEPTRRTPLYSSAASRCV